MARAGARARSTGGSAKERVVAAAVETLKREGYASTSARAVARTGGFAQGVVFYHFGGMTELLLAALDATSEARLARYREVVGRARTLPELLALLPELYAEDRDSGHMRVVSQLVAGSLNRPELSRAVLERMEPWLALAEETLGRLLPDGLPARELAYAAVTFELGVNLMTHLDPGHERTDAVFERTRELAPLLAALGPLGG